MKRTAVSSLLFAVVLFMPTFAQNTLQEVELDSVGVIYKRMTSPIFGDTQQMHWSTKSMKALPKILGNANPLHLVQFLPGIQTNSEYEAGIHIQGCENGHNQISIAGVPVYNPSHLLGFFSTFNTSHFSDLALEKNAQTLSGNHLGGDIRMELMDDIIPRCKGEISIGPLSSQGTIRIPTSKKSTLVISTRSSYMNLLYGNWLKKDDTELKYQFGDYNLTFFYAPTPNDKIWLDGYLGIDKGKVIDHTGGASLKVRWGNILGAAHWKHRFRTSRLTQSIYTTNYYNKFELKLVEDIYNLPSSINDYGYKATWDKSHLKIGGQAVIHRIQPQNPVLPEDKTNTTTRSMKQQYSKEFIAFAEYQHPLVEKWTLKGGLKGTCYVDPDHKTHVDFSPALELTFTPKENQRLLFNYQWQQQYLNQTGVSNMGMPTEFWYSCNKEIDPQKAHSLSFSYELSLFDGDWKLSTSIYFKRLTNQVEYVGSLLDVIEEKYRMEDNLAGGTGMNYGLNLLLNKCTGKWSGWISYSLGRALREFDHPNLGGRYPSNHERIHELNLLATYRPSPKWELSATGVVASGTPFTAPDYIYWCNGQIITHFGEHNANRLKPYIRLDLSANYIFKKTTNGEHGFNLSLYNASMVKNDIFYRMKFHNNKFYYRPLRFVAQVLPSINYYCRF